MSKEELTLVIGGGVNATLINAIARSIDAAYSLGRALGSALHRLTKGKVCSV